MNSIKRIFWNSQEKRLRMIWRLTGQTILMVLFLAINQIFISIIGVIFLADDTFLSVAEIIFNPNNPLFLITTISTFLATVTSIWVAGQLFDRRQFSNFGFNIDKKWWVDFTFGLGLGAILIFFIFLIELSLGWITISDIFVTTIPDLDFLGAITLPLVMYVFVGFYEELLSRGYHLTNLAEGFSGKMLGPRSAIFIATIISSALFGLLHVYNPNFDLISMLNISLAGIFLAIGYVLTGQLAIPIGVHIGWNFFQGNVFGFPVSGSNYHPATFLKIQQDGPDFWTGGAFGPEGGLLGTIFTLLGILCILIWKKQHHGKLDIYLPISESPLQHMQKKHSEDLLNNSNELSKGAKNPGYNLDKYSHIIWDWNGTLLNDLQLCLEIINDMLAKRHLPAVTKEDYQDVFGFPVEEYYLKIGFDFDKEPFEVLSTEFINAYEEGRPSCLMMGGSKKILHELSVLGYKQAIVSASKQAYLLKAVDEYGIKDYFTAINGLDNHHADGKINIAKQFVNGLDIRREQILLIGDTLHDAEIAKVLSLDCFLIPNGHQSYDRLRKSGFPIVNTLEELTLYFQQIRWIV